MRLTITRDQAKGLLGGVKFQLDAKVELSTQESDLIAKYKVHKEVLLKKQVNFFGRTMEFNTTIGDLVSGQSYKCSDIAEIIQTEENVKQACEYFKQVLTTMKEFGGQEVVDY